MRKFVHSLIACLLCLTLYATTFAQSYPITGTINKNANLRAGPGTSFTILGTATAGQTVTIVGTNAKGNWYQLDGGQWIAAFLVTINTASQVEGQTLQPTATTAAQPIAPPAPQQPSYNTQTNSKIGSVSFFLAVNRRNGEVLSLKNRSDFPIDIGGWTIFGSVDSDSCTIPYGTILNGWETYQVATGTYQPRNSGLKCADRSLWNSGESIYLQSPDGQQVTIMK